jgi:hypothetical protein
MRGKKSSREKRATLKTVERNSEREWQEKRRRKSSKKKAKTAGENKHWSTHTSGSCLAASWTGGRGARRTGAQEGAEQD